MKDKRPGTVARAGQEAARVGVEGVTAGWPRREGEGRSDIRRQHERPVSRHKLQQQKKKLNS